MSRVFYTRTMGEVLDDCRRAWRMLTGRRKYDAAKINRLTADWTTISKSADYDIEQDLGILRARSRQLCENYDYGKRFMDLIETHVIGSGGIMLQSKVKTAAGKLDKPVNDAIEAAWKDFCRKGNCTSDGQLTMREVVKLAAQALARDGEPLIQLLRGRGPHGLLLKPLDSDFLDHTYTDTRLRIRMGVEIDQEGRPTAYHLLREHPGDRFFISMARDRRRVPAAEIIHFFNRERAQQTRGVPWTRTAMRRMHMTGKYEETELVAARVSAAKMGFFVNANGQPFPYDDKDAKGNLISEVSPGHLGQLPPGWDFRPFDPEHPNAGFEAFVKAVLRGAAAGLNISYATLTGDLRDVNFSSIRHGVMEERDAWKIFQQAMIDHVLDPVFREWLPQAVAFGKLDLPFADLEQYISPYWQPRRWAWVDPLKDVQAKVTAIANKLESRSDTISETGRDPEEVFAKIEEEEARLGPAAGPAQKLVSGGEGDASDGQGSDQNGKILSYSQFGSGGRRR